MQDPSAGVQPPLDKHVHLTSNHAYPTMAQIGLEQAFRSLIDAPSIVKQHATMSWKYVTAPHDGTMWLEWLAPGQNGGRLPSDGYVWSDPEQTYRHNINGYVIEMLVHQSGFRAGHDHMTSHARTRYHFIAKAPQVNAAAPDPSLWIVHYHHAPTQRIVPTSQVQLDPYSRHIMEQRKWLETQGGIDQTKEFMLHDRERWPTVTTRAAQQQQLQHAGYYGPGAMQNQAMMAQNRYGQPPFPQSAGMPFAKRQRIQGPGVLPVAPETAGPDHGVDDEEYTLMADYFDHLTPREISLTRFQQHHSWMEEVFQSPHSLQNIIPIDLGLGLMGELKGLTEGILQPPVLDELLDKTPSTPPATSTSQTFTNVPQDQLEEFNSRVQKHIEEGKAEMERMKAEHASKMREWRKTYKLTQAETQLRNASWKDHDGTYFKAREEGSNEYADAAQKTHIEDVIGSVESLVQLKIKPHTDATLVEKGGLQRVERHRPDPSAQQQHQASDVAASDPGLFQQSTTDGQNGISDAPQNVPATAAQPSIAGHVQTGNENAGMPNLSNPGAQGDGLDLLNDSMDIDAADLEFDLDGTNENNTLGQAPPPAVESSTSHEAIQTITAAQPGVGGANVGEGVAASSANTALNDSAGTGGEAGVFNDANFDFDNELGAGGENEVDGLIDFGDDDGIGMDDSAFGDALHGMDS